MPTLTDVAALAGVSRATASKAINGRSDVALETRAKVLQAAEALSFTPNPYAQALNSIRSGTIGMLTTDLFSRFILPVLRGAEDAFGAGSTTVLLCDARGDVVREQHHIKMLLGKRVDGLLVVGRTTNPRYSLSAGVTVPVVYVYEPSDDPTDISFTPDNRQGGRLAVEHLIARGRRRIGLINGDPSFAAAVDRAAGATEALAEIGLDLVAGNRLYGQWSKSWGRHAVDVLLDTSPGVDGIFCAADQIARGALERLRERGIAVPEDIAVIGFDNADELAEITRPPLTSVDMNLAELGRAAAKELVRAIGGEHRSGVIYGDVRVVPRQSTGTM